MTAIRVQYLKTLVTENSGWFSIHRKQNFTDRVPTFPGNAHQTIRSALQDISYWLNRGHDIYLAQGMFRNPGEHKQGFPHPDAIRQGPNLLACRSLYMDVDVKDGAYPTTAEAAKHIKEFIVKCGLPMPTIINESGTGGFHIYWVFNDFFEQKIFRHMASQLTAAAQQFGVHFDPQCTNDPIRLLRVPDTWNFKHGGGEHALPVIMRYHSNTLLDIAAMQSALSPFKATVTLKGKRTPSEFDVNDDLGTNDQTYPPVELDKVAAVCPLVAHTLATGGADLIGEPEWHSMVALACHMLDASVVVHKLCEKNQYYNAEDVNKKLATAQLQRQQRSGIGPPLCATLALGAGKNFCHACPHHALNTTPLAVSFKITKPTTVSTNDDLPPRYYRGTNTHIYYSPPDDGKAVDVEVFDYPIIQNSGFVEEGKPYKLTFDTTQAGQQVRKTFLSNIYADLTSLAGAYAGEGMPITVDIKQAKAFWMHYLKLLRSNRETLVSAEPFGWSPDENGDTGFAFDGSFYSPAGTFKCRRAIGSIGSDYHVVGGKQAWTDLANIILTSDRPDLMVLVAAGFGAPLVALSGQLGFVMGTHSIPSGIGKTTALMETQGMWGNPIMSGFSDTVNYTFAKAGELHHLPLIYDEIKNRRQIDDFARGVAFQLTQGSDKGRSARDGSAKKKKEFQTTLIYASNATMYDAVREHSEGSAAGEYRVFEFPAITNSNKSPHFISQVATVAMELRSNYGAVGAIYAEFLGKNHKKLKPWFYNYQIAIEKKLVLQNGERFWLAAIATTLAGAEIANGLGLAKFDIKAMWQFMSTQFYCLRKNLLMSPDDYTNINAIYETLAQFINLKFERNTIMTRERANRGAGRPALMDILGERHNKQYSRIDVHIHGNPLTLRVSVAALAEWCKLNNKPRAALMASLKEMASAQIENVILTAGTHLSSMQQQVLTIPVRGTPLEHRCEYALIHGVLP